MHKITIQTNLLYKSVVKTDTTSGELLNPIEMLTKEYVDCARSNSLLVTSYEDIEDVAMVARILGVEYVVLKEDDNWHLIEWIQQVEACGNAVPVVDGYFIVKL